MTVSISLADTVFHLRSRSERVLAAAREHFKGFEAKGLGWTVDLEEADPRELPDGPLAERHEDGWVFTRLGELHMRVNGRTAEARVGALPDYFPPGSLQNLLRLLLVIELAPRGGLLLHAASEASGVAFFGRSGAGKSTLARGFKSLLSDEISCLVGGHLFRAPFTGERLPPPQALNVPARALVAIERGETFTVRRLDAAEGLRRLLACVVNVSTERALSLQLFDNAQHLSLPILAATFPLLPNTPALAQPLMDKWLEAIHAALPPQSA